MKSSWSLLLVVLLTVPTGAQEGAGPRIASEVGKRLQGRTYHAIDEAYTLTIPDLGARETLAVVDRARERGTESVLTMKADTGTVAEVYVARILLGIPNGDRILDRETCQAGPGRASSGRLVFALRLGRRFFTGSEAAAGQRGRYLQFTMLNEGHIPDRPKGAFAAPLHNEPASARSAFIGTSPCVGTCTRPS